MEAHDHVLSVEEILAAKDIQEKSLFIPEWGGSIKITGLTKSQQQAMRRRSMVDGGIDADLIEMHMFIEGVAHPKFTSDQYLALMEKSAGIIDEVLTAIARASNMDPEEMRRARRDFRVK